jgi:DNA-binding LytR/AlgR family response regulator
MFEIAPSKNIIFSDIDMPGSMNGLKLAKVARLRWPPIEIILTSANVDLPLGELPERCLFIPKPYKCEHLVEKLRSLAR